MKPLKWVHGRSQLIKLLALRCARMSLIRNYHSQPFVTNPDRKWTAQHHLMLSLWHWPISDLYLSICHRDFKMKSKCLAPFETITIFAFVFTDPISWNSLFNDRGDPWHTLWPSLLMPQIKSNGKWRQQGKAAFSHSLGGKQMTRIKGLISPVSRIRAPLPVKVTF